MLNYVHVASKAPKSGVDYNPAVLNQTGYCLYSLIDGLRQKDFNSHTLMAVMDSIQEYAARYVQPVEGKLFTDSGGFSIIQGDVHPTEVARFIQCYDLYMVRERKIYSRIFSLDIPWSKRFPELNTRENIYRLNRMALQLAKGELSNYPELRDKYYFVWHFKMASQYAIWSRLYQELDLNSLILHRAIGGMVGVKKAAGIRFSPFTGIAYRCLLDYLDSPAHGRPYTLHFLGLYTPGDRFQIVILEALARRVLGESIPVEFTYDSINPSQAARMNTGLPFFYLKEGQLVTLSNIIQAPEGLLGQVYASPDLLDFVKEEIARRQAGLKFRHAGTLAPLNIFSTMQLDKFFAQVVEETGLADILAVESSLTKIYHHAHNILQDLNKKHPAVFTRDMVKGIEANIETVFPFQRWLMTNRSRDKLQDLMEALIARIRFPGDLT